MNLLPRPRILKRLAGVYRLPMRAGLCLEANEPALSPVVKRLQTAAHDVGVELSIRKAAKGKAQAGAFRLRPAQRSLAGPGRTGGAAGGSANTGAPQPSPAVRIHPEGYRLRIDRRGVLVEYCDLGGLRAAVATLRQLLREFGRRLPFLAIHDWPDFARRGVMLDISRGRVPTLDTLLGLVDHLADFKINEFQLYLEHTFAYRNYRPVWREWGALTGREISRLDARCRVLGIDLVPNQNSFGHLRQWLEYPPLQKLAEVAEPYESVAGGFLRRPSTLAPNHPATLPFLRGLYDELLPHFSSDFFNVGCDETWDLGRGQSKALCKRKGIGRVYVDFLKKIHREVSARGRRMMFWGDLIMEYPGLIRELASWRASTLSPTHPEAANPAATRCGASRPSRPSSVAVLRRVDSSALPGSPVLPPSGGSESGPREPAEAGLPNLIALNWGYEANHPFDRETRRFAEAGVPFYVCPGTSTWTTLIGRHDNALRNLRRAAAAGRRHGAVGYLITDWGDGGHPQPLAVSYLPYLAGASLSWCAESFDERRLVPVLNRDVFYDPTGRLAAAAFALGLAHRRFGFNEPNATPLGTVIAAPPPAGRELFCRNGLKHYRSIPGKNVRATLAEVERQLAIVRRARPGTRAGKILAQELNLAARMAAHSCKFMLWQQARAAGEDRLARRLAKRGILDLGRLDRDFNAYWPLRNKGTTQKCSVFLEWRMADYRVGLKPSRPKS